jgi:hypothetical protein
MYTCAAGGVDAIVKDPRNRTVSAGTAGSDGRLARDDGIDVGVLVGTTGGGCGSAAGPTGAVLLGGSETATSPGTRIEGDEPAPAEIGALVAFRPGNLTAEP